MRDRRASGCNSTSQTGQKKWTQGTAADRIQAEKALSQWRENPELAALREPDALDRLSADERKECNALWSEVAALITRARVGM